MTSEHCQLKLDDVSIFCHLAVESTLLYSLHRDEKCCPVKISTIKYQYAPSGTTMHHHAPQSITMHHRTPPCTIKHHHAPPGTIIHHQAPPYTMMHHQDLHEPLYTIMDHQAPSCTTGHHTKGDLRIEVHKGIQILHSIIRAEILLK